MVGNASLISVALLRRDSGSAEHSQGQILFSLIYLSQEKSGVKRKTYLFTKIDEKRLEK